MPISNVGVCRFDGSDPDPELQDVSDEGYAYSNVETSARLSAGLGRDSLAHRDEVSTCTKDGARESASSR